MVECIPSPACKDRLGENIGDGRVDLWGDKVKRVQVLDDNFDNDESESDDDDDDVVSRKFPFLIFSPGVL